MKTNKAEFFQTENLTREGMNFDPFMALELQEDGLAYIQGKFYLDDSAEMDERELSKYKDKFPPEEKGKPKIKINI